MLRRWSLAVALSALLLPGARGQVPSGDEVPYIRTPQVVVDKMLELARVGPDDFVIDLGSGDGRIVITAAQTYGARGFGVELDPALVDASNDSARKAGVADRARFYTRDLFDTDISRASVLTMYLLPEFNLQLRPRILAQLKPGTRVVSHDWDMGEWQPDAKLVLDGVVKPVMPLRASTVYLWIVPAKVAGQWKLRLDGAQPASMDIEFRQLFQNINGTITSETGRARLQNAGLRGADIRFAVVDEARPPSEIQEFSGRVHGDTMEGTLTGGLRWRAQRNVN